MSLNLTYTNPLSEVSNSQLKTLGETLWNWPGCPTCRDAFSCPEAECSSFRAEERLSPYIDFYKRLTSTYVPEFAASGQIALRTHEDLFDLIRFVRTNRDKTRAGLMKEHFEARMFREKGFSTPTNLDQERALNLAMRVMTMVSCAAERQVSTALESDTQPITWANDFTLSQFMSRIFPVTDHPSLNDPNQARRSALIKDSLRAKRLTKLAGLTLKGTDDLQDHLRLNCGKGYVEIFRHTRFLKEYLAAGKISQAQTANSTTRDPIDIISRQLALEVIDSIQTILFPFDSDSEPLLRSLIAKKKFDPDCLRLDSTSYRWPDETDIKFHHFGSRMMDLFEEVEDPGPRSRFEKWLQRKGGNGRYNMLLALAGLFFALILGILGLGVAIFQSWVAYYAWKTPVATPNNLV